MRYTAAAVLAAVALPATLFAQPNDGPNQLGRNLLAARLGLTGTAEASASASQTTARASGLGGSLSYSRFVMSSVAVEVSGSVLDASATASGASASTEADAVSAVLVGLVYSPAFLALSPAVRPFVSAAFGPYFHHVSEAGAMPAAVQATTQSQAGGRLGAGVNFYVARHFALQMTGDYHLVQPFEPVNGTSKDASGFTLSFGLALAWGSQ